VWGGETRRGSCSASHSGPPGSLGGSGNHLDGYGASVSETGAVSAFSVGATAYLADVDERGSGFTVWPGSQFGAGTVVLWRNKLAHAGGPNVSGDVRTAAVRQFERRDARPRGAAAEPFKYRPGLEGVHVTPG
jgi:hypothetical protein